MRGKKRAAVGLPSAGPRGRFELIGGDRGCAYIFRAPPSRSRPLFLCVGHHAHQRRQRRLKFLQARFFFDRTHSFHTTIVYPLDCLGVHRHWSYRRDHLVRSLLRDIQLLSTSPRWKRHCYWGNRFRLSTRTPRQGTQKTTSAGFFEATPKSTGTLP